jgi:hypothetical protein
VKIIRLIKMCLNETYCRVQLGKYLFGTLAIINALMKEDALIPLRFNFALESVIGRIKQTWKG